MSSYQPPPTDHHAREQKAIASVWFHYVTTEATYFQLCAECWARYIDTRNRRIEELQGELVRAGAPSAKR
jgi:hypothetical protein